MKIRVKKLNPDAVIPQYATAGAAGFDLVAVENIDIFPGDTKLVKTGLVFELEPGYELQVRPRSGISLKTPLIVKNSPGTVDSDYRGEVCVIISNIERYSEFGGQTGYPYSIKKGDRIAQGVVQKVEQAQFELVETVEETDRGNKGFGSTGK